MEKMKIENFFNHSLKSKMIFEISKIDYDLNQYRMKIQDHNIDIELIFILNEDYEIIEIISYKLKYFNELENLFDFEDYLELFLMIQNIKSKHNFGIEIINKEL